MILIGMNVAVFIGILLWTRDPGALTGSTDAHLQLAVGRDVLAYPINWRGAGVTEPDEWYRLVTSGFTHYGIIHLALNMYFLYVLGPLLEPQLGRVRFLLLYMASLLAGSLGAILLSPSSLTAGASGAVFGLMAAASVGLWRRGINPFSTSIGQILLLNLFLTFVISGISIGGHLGGAIAGAICATVMLAPPHQPSKVWITYATPIAVSVISVVASVLVVGAA